MKLSKLDKGAESLLDKIARKDIKWTNRHDCPPGYTFNSEEWIETSLPFPKISVNFLPYMANKLGEYKLLLQNLLALRLLNDVSHADLELVLWNRSRQAFLGRDPDKDIFDAVVAESKKITDTTQLPSFDEAILRMDTIWYSRSCSEKGKASIKAKIRDNYISDVRSLMPIDRKYKTNEVMMEAAVTKYAVNLYWKNESLDSRSRTISSIVEALNEIEDIGELPTLELVAAISGVSGRSIQRYKDMWSLTE